jgi:hypothetical protein
MPNHSNYNLSFQPKTYWDLRDVLTHVEARVTGKARKELVKHALQNGETVPSEYLKSSLSGDLKQSIGSIDPSFMGGEFLPELGENDVIIASINLKSTTSDVIAVIARLTDKGIEYRVEDEYMDSYPEGEDHYKVQPNFSKEPLSFKELINLIDNAREGGGLIDSAKNFYPEEPEEYYDFATAESAFYPQLRDWYDESNNEWLESKLELKRQKEIEEEECRRKEEQGKKSIQKSEIQFRPMTQEEADRKNSGGATQIVLNRRRNKSKPTKKPQVRTRPGTQEGANRLNAGGATQIVLNRRERKYEVSPENLKIRSKN